MEQKKVTDDLLKDILPKVSNELVEEWESESIEEYTFSKKFNRKTKALIWKHKNKQLMKELKVVGKIAAALLLVVGIAFFGNSMVARANLDVLFKKIEVALEDSSMYVYDENSDMHFYTLYEPTYVPEGYEEISRCVDDKNITIYYGNNENEIIYWTQCVVMEGPIVGSDDEYDDIIIKEYKGDNIHIYIYQSKTNRLLYEMGNFVFCIKSDNISLEEIYEMIKEMKKIEK